MKLLISFLLNMITTLLKLIKPGGVKALVSENLILKQQLLILKRKHKRSPKLSPFERITLGVLTELASKKRLSKITVIIKPATLFKFHQALVKRKYRWLFSNKHPRKPGPKGPSEALIQAIVEMKKRNPLFGYRRIAMQITLAFGISVDKDVVRRVLNKHYSSNPTGQGTSWLTLVGHTLDSLWSLDFFRVESIILKSHWVMVIMDQFSRRIIGFAVGKGHLNGINVCQMFNHIISKQRLPKYLSTDNDPLLLFHRCKANLRILEIKEIKSVPQQPRSHPFIERLIKSIRNELCNQLIFWSARDLQHKLECYKNYFNQYRAHMGLNGKIPNEVAQNSKNSIINLKNYRWQSYCRGLFQLPIAV